MAHKSVTAYILGLVALSFALAILVSFIPLFQTASLADAPSTGCCGYLLVHKDAGEPDPITAGIMALPRVGLFHLHAHFFNAGGSVDWVIKKQSDGTQVLSGALTIQADGSGQTNQLHLPNGQYIVSYHEAGCPGGDKFLEFIVERQSADPASTINPTGDPSGFVTPSIAAVNRQAQVSVVCQGCWSSIAQVWVGGTEQPSQVLAPDATGALATLWTFWNRDLWQIRVRVTLPTGLDTNRWKLILWVGTGPKDYIWVDDYTFTLAPHQLNKVSFQLVDTYFWQ